MIFNMEEPRISESEQSSFDKIKELLKLAKVTESDLLPTSQALVFGSNNLDHESLRFLELDKELLENLEAGRPLYITGDDEENAVIATESSTYDLALTQTSNSLLLVKDLKFCESLQNNVERNLSKVTVAGIFQEYLEAKPSKPYLAKLNLLLKKSLYRGPEQEYQIKSEDLLSYEDLDDRIQSSKNELKKALALMPVVKMDEKIRLLDFEYHFRVLSYMLKLIDENSWALDEIDYDVTINSLSDLVPTSVLNTVFDLYTEESKIIDGLQLYRYKESTVCQFFARVLLYTAGKFNFTEFLQAWKESVPDGMNASEDMLIGIAIIDRTSEPNVIWAFSEENLPENITERFKVLFSAKEKWTVPEITPYIQQLATQKTDVNALLAKYARVSTVGGVKYYSSKHGK